MNKTLFQLVFLACLAVSGCAAPPRLFSKKPQSYDDFLAQRKAAEKERVATSSSVPDATADVSELLNKGHAAFQQGAMSEAQTNYLAVVKRQPNHPVANHRLAVIADRQPDFATAERYYIAALSATPHDADLLNDMGYSYLLQSRYADAERYLQLALRQNPKQANAINNLGMIYGKQGQYDRALSLFRQTASEAEAQAKLSKIVQTAPAATASAGSMIPNNAGAAPTNVLANNDASLPNDAAWPNGVPASPNGVNPAWTSSAAGQSGRSQLVPTQSQAQSQFIPTNSQPQTQFPTSPSQAYSGTLASQPTIDDPNVPDATRQLKAMMEQKRLAALADWQARDEAERTRREALLRQVRAEEMGLTNVISANGSLPNGANGFAQNATTVSNGPIIIGPPNSAGVPIQSQTAQPQTGFVPSQPAPTNSQNVAAQLSTIPQPPASTFSGSSVPSTGLNPPPISRTNNAAFGSPLETMPIWPPAESLPSKPATSAIIANPASIPNVSWPSRQRPSNVDDATRQASQWGMNVGPGNLFPITPGPASQPSRSTSEPNAWPQSNGFTPNGPRNWPTNTPQPVPGSAFAVPMSRTNGPPAFNTSANQQTTLPLSVARAALQDQVPPSEQYQTPTAFGLLSSPNNAAVQPASFATNRAQPMSYRAPSPIQQANELERAGTRSTVPDRFGGDDRWEQGPSPTGSTPIRSAPTNQGFIAAPAGENAFSEYERMIQMHNAELNSIRQQLDTQRQQPGSELFFRSTTLPQMGTPTGADPKLGLPTGTIPGQSPMNSPGRW